MQSSSQKVFLIGNEMGTTDAFAEALTKEGYHVQVFAKPDEAYQKIPVTPPHLIVCDCMLPGSLSGVDFAEKLKSEGLSEKIKVALASAIFTDKAFIDEALAKTKAVAFFKKNAELTPALFVKKIKELLPVQIQAPTAPQATARKMLYEMFSKKSVSQREKRKVIEALEEVSGYDLPFIWSLLVETKSSGYLNIFEKSGSVSGITLSSGNIIAVDTEDAKTVLGEMLIQSGYAIPESVQAALKERTNQKIGQKLIQANELSPHAFDLVLIEQMNVRLSRAIVDQDIRINFASTEVEMSYPCIDSNLLLEYLHDWIASKLSLNWLKAQYVSLSANKIELSAHFQDNHVALETSLVRSAEGLIELLKAGTTLNSILEGKKQTESNYYKAIHFLLTKGLIYFGQRSAPNSEQERMAILNKIWHDIQGKNHFEIIQLMGQENLAPDKLNLIIGDLPVDKASPTYNIWSQLKARLEETYSKSQDVSQIENLKIANKNKESENKLKALQLAEAAKQSLLLNQFAIALEKVTQMQKLSVPVEHLNILSAWAKMGNMNAAKKQQIMKDVEFDLVQVPAEEKYDAMYPYVVGLYNRHKGDLVAAKKNFEKAAALNSSFMPARRDLNLVNSEIKSSKQDILTMDLKQMVSGFFKKK